MYNRAAEIAARILDTYADEMLTEAERPEFYRNAEQWREMIEEAAAIGLSGPTLT